jgi:hypothetical protein
VLQSLSLVVGTVLTFEDNRTGEPKVVSALVTLIEFGLTEAVAWLLEVFADGSGERRSLSTV